MSQEIKKVVPNNTGKNSAAATDSNKQAQEQSKGLRIAKRIGNIVFYTLISLFLIGGILGIIGKFTSKGNGIGLFGNNFYVVVTDSMERVNDEYKDFLAGHNDRIKVGDLIVTRRIKKNENLRVYDIVTFMKDGQTIVHRIVDISTDSEGRTWYTTRGDSNNVHDGKRTKDEFTGIVIADAGKGWGEIVKFFQSYYGIAASTGAIAVILIAILVNDSLSKKSGSGTKRDKEREKINELFGDWKFVAPDNDNEDDDDEDIDGSDYD